MPVDAVTVRRAPAQVGRFSHRPHRLNTPDLCRDLNHLTGLNVRADANRELRQPPQLIHSRGPSRRRVSAWEPRRPRPVRQAWRGAMFWLT
jgi:hypothetical protein